MDIEKIIRGYIDKSIHMSLGTSHGSRPWVCEVHFVYDSDLNLYFRSLQTRRHSQDIARNPNVAGNIVKQHTILEAGQGIYFEGRATLIEDETMRKQLFPLFRERLKATEAILADAQNSDGHQFYTINVETWYAFGLFGASKAQKYELPWHKASLN